jgi:hypothetical protein
MSTLDIKLWQKGLMPVLEPLRGILAGIPGALHQLGLLQIRYYAPEYPGTCSKTTQVILTPAGEADFLKTGGIALYYSMTDMAMRA